MDNKIKAALQKVLAGGRKLTTSITPHRDTQADLLAGFQTRLEAWRAVMGKVEALYPNDRFSKDDVAFGYLKNHEFVAATDFVTPEVEIGYIAHVVMLVALGYAKDENDTAPKVDYLVRGIVKAEMNRDVIFWETPHDLLDNTAKFKALQECLRQLLKKRLISNDNNVYGAEVNLSMGTVEQLLGE